VNVDDCGCADDGETRAALVGVSASGLALRRGSFRAVLDGEARALDDLAREAGASADEAAELARRDLVLLDGAGRVVGAAGLSLEPIRQHRLSVRGRVFWTWCAIDAVGIPSALGEDAEVETTCHHCAAPVRLRFREGVVAEASHPDARLWNADHVPGRSMARGTCGLMNLFCSAGHLDAWRAANPEARGAALDLDASAALGRQWWGPLVPARNLEMRSRTAR
jgi:alkylmercury lyase